jgi:hypothetical protein
LIGRRYRASKLDCMGLLIEAANAVRARPLAKVLRFIHEDACDLARHRNAH